MSYIVEKILTISDPSYQAVDDIPSFISEYYRLMLQDNLISPCGLDSSEYFMKLKEIRRASGPILPQEKWAFDDMSYLSGRKVLIFDTESTYSIYKEFLRTKFNSEFDSSISSNNVSLTVIHHGYS